MGETEKLAYLALQYRPSYPTVPILVIYGGGSVVGVSGNVQYESFGDGAARSITATAQTDL